MLPSETASSNPRSAAVPDRDGAPELPELVIEGVSKVFTDHPGGTAALAEVSTTVRRGEFVSIVGPSGSGKSTLLRIVADLTAPSTGWVRVCGLTAAEARRQRKLGMVFQSPVLYPWRTVIGNVELPLEVAGIPRGERRRLADETLALVSLTEFKDRRPRQLSGGMQQRVAIARALAVRPRVLLMDEPFASLDELARERLNLELLRLWHETGVTVLFVTHLIGEAVLLADRVLVLSARPGRLTAEIDVPLPRPRGVETRASEEYFRVVNAVRSVLRGGSGGAEGV
jgi:NitT/TauT family transport system ATP-binding protein